MALSKALVTIKTDMELPVTLEDMAYSGNFQGKLAQLFDFYEFSSLKRYLDGHIVSEGVASGEGLSSALLRNPVRANAPESPSPDATPEIKDCPLQELIASHPAKLGIVVSGKNITLSDGKAAARSVIAGPDRQSLKALLEDPSIEKYGDDLKKAANALAAEGMSLEGHWNDVRLMHYVIDPERSHDPAQLSKSILGIDFEAAPEKVSTGSLFDDIPDEEEPSRSLEAAAMVLLGDALRKDLPDFYDKMEEPLSKVLAKMERDGVKVALRQLSHFADALRVELVQREARIREMAGDPTLNISSP